MFPLEVHKTHWYCKELRSILTRKNYLINEHRNAKAVRSFVAMDEVRRGQQIFIYFIDYGGFFNFLFKQQGILNCD